MSFLDGHPWMDLDMKMFDFDTNEMAVSNFRQFLRKVADNIKSANTDKSTFKRLRGVEGVCI